MPADQRFSAGARFERKAFREKLRRNPTMTAVDLLAWVLDRQKRYDKRQRGLGKG